MYLTTALLATPELVAGQLNTRQLREIDSLNLLIRSTKDPVEKVEAYANLGEIYYVFDMDTAASLMFTANKIAIDALSFCELDRKKEPMARFLSSSLSNLGWYYMNKGKIAMALAHNFKSLEIHEYLRNDRGKAYCYQNIGEIYEMQGDDKSAMRFFRMANEIHTNLRYISGMTGSLDLMAEVWLQRGEVDSALRLLLLAEDLSNDIKQVELYNLEEIYANIGTAYLTKGDTARSIVYNFKALELGRSIGSKSGLSDALRNLSRIDLARNNLESARQYAEESYDAAMELGFPDRIKKASHLLSRIEARLGNYKKALKAYQSFNLMRDSLRNNFNQRISLQLEQKFKYEQDKLLKTKQYDREMELESLEQRRLRVVSWMGLATLLAALLIAWSILRRYNVIRKQKKTIGAQNQQILKGLEYSREIQHALLPPVNQFEKHFSSHFVFFEPLETVGGDFYSVRVIGDIVVIVCADCTGHGVRGGLMSTMSSLLLDKTIHSGRTDPGEILARLNHEIIRALHQHEGRSIQDGMEMAVCTLNLKTGKMKFAGARNGMVIFRAGGAERLKPAMFPVGGEFMKKGIEIERRFEVINTQLQPGDWFCMYTDGYAEQIGGGNNLPMTYKQTEDLIAAALSMENPTQIRLKLAGQFAEWQGENQRVDDVCVIGFRFKPA